MQKISAPYKSFLMTTAFLNFFSMNFVLSSIYKTIKSKKKITKKKISNNFFNCWSLTEHHQIQLVVSIIQLPVFLIERISILFLLLISIPFEGFYRADLLQTDLSLRGLLWMKHTYWRYCLFCHAFNSFVARTLIFSYWIL